jgi:hypothetical protein
MQDELLERSPALGHDEQPAGLATGNEGFLDGAPPGDDLIAGFDEAGFSRLEPRPIEAARTGEVGPATLDEGALRAATERPRAGGAVAIGPPRFGSIRPATG